MRVAYICADPGVPAFGQKGASVHLQGIVGALLKRGAEVHLLVTRTGGKPPRDLRQLRVHRLPAASSDEPSKRERDALAANAVLRSTLRSLGDLDLVYERYSLWSYAGMEHARERALPGILEVNAPLIEEQARHRGLFHRDEAESVARRAFGAASAIVAVSDVVAEYVRGSFGEDRVHVVPNGVDPERFPRVGPRVDAARRHYTIGFLGTLKPWHDLDALVEAFALARVSIPDARLLVIGDGPGRSRVESRLRELDLEGAASLTGALPPPEIPGRLALVDTAVAPYPRFDRFYFSPLKLLEYLAAGLPVVASRVGQVPDLVEHGRTGLLCPPGDVDALAAALIRLGRDPQLRGALGSEGRRRVLERHTWDAVCARVMALAGDQPAATAA